MVMIVLPITNINFIERSFLGFYRLTAFKYEYEKTSDKR